MALQATGRVEGLEPVSRFLTEAVKRQPELTAQVMQTSAIAVIIPAARRNLQKNRSIFTGELFNRMTARGAVEGGRSVVDVGSFGVPYGLNVEKGSPPGQPDIKRILEYVQKKLGLKGRAAKLIAAKIFRTISKKGTKKHPYLLPAIKANQGRLIRDFTNRFNFRLTGVAVSTGNTT